jgi:hypothetical protein
MLATLLARFAAILTGARLPTDRMHLQMGMYLESTLKTPFTMARSS